MASDLEIRLVTDFMDQMIAQMGDVRSRVEHLSEAASATSLSNAPESHEAYLRLSGRWDDKRSELRETLELAIKALSEIKEAFETADEELASQLGSDVND